MHIKDRIIVTLVTEGWEIDKGETCDRLLSGPSGDFIFKKTLEGFEQTGHTSNGTRTVTLSLECSGRYLARIDSWGIVQRDVDLRNYQEADEAVRDVLAA